MAKIECVVNYDETTRKTSIETHIFTEDSDTIQFVTQSPGLAVKPNKAFSPTHYLAGTPVPLAAPPKDLLPNVAPKFNVYYHGPRADFDCGYIDDKGNFQRWKAGVEGPGGGPG